MKLDELRELTHRADPTREYTEQEKAALLRSLGLDPGNLYQELEMSHRYVDTHRDVTYSNAMVSLHSHTFYELLYCTNTCGVEYLLGAERYRLQKGDILLVPPGVSHRPLLPAQLPEPYRRDLLWLSEEMIALVNQTLPPAERGLYRSIRLLRTAGTPWEFLGELFRTGVREAEHRQPGWEMAVLGNTLQLLTHLRRAAEDRSAAPLRAEQPQLLDRVLAYVEEHLAEKLSLGEVARQFWVSESTITQLFHHKMGVSFYRCVTQRRLIAAKSRILAGEPLEAVAPAVGFADYSTFYRAFKREYGISPRQYRKMQEEGR